MLIKNQLKLCQTLIISKTLSSVMTCGVLKIFTNISFHNVTFQNVPASQA